MNYYNWINSWVFGLFGLFGLFKFLPFCVFSSNLHGLATTRTWGSKSTQNNVRQRTIHGHAHDVTQDCSGRTYGQTKDLRLVFPLIVFKKILTELFNPFIDIVPLLFSPIFSKSKQTQNIRFFYKNWTEKE